MRAHSGGVQRGRRLYGGISGFFLISIWDLYVKLIEIDYISLVFLPILI
jgi:hypothetical protein